MSNRNSRIQWMHARIASGSFPNERRISEKFGVSERQARRDIAFMRDELGAPIAYDYAAKGFYYTKSFNLPAMITDESADDYAGFTEKLSGNPEPAANSTVQLRIPYIAEIETKDKLALLELKSFITSSSPRKHRYVCEFHSVELFLGVVMALGAEIRIVSPDWLRERAINSAEKMLKANK